MPYFFPRMCTCPALEQFALGGAQKYLGMYIMYCFGFGPCIVTRDFCELAHSRTQMWEWLLHPRPLSRYLQLSVVVLCPAGQGYGASLETRFFQDHDRLQRKLRQKYRVKSDYMCNRPL